MCIIRHNTPRMLPFVVNFRPGEPPYEEIIFAVKRAVATGRLKSGNAFPSVRTLSRELKLNPNTCQKAVTALKTEGILSVQPGVGTIICERPEISTEETISMLHDVLENLVVEARQLGLSEVELKRAVSEKWRNLK